VFVNFGEESKNSLTEILKIAPKFGLKPFPDGVNFVKSLTLFKEKQSEFSLNTYLNALKDCAENKKIKNFNIIVQFANNLLQNNYLYSTNLIKWCCDGEFSFEQNSDKELIVKLSNTNLTCYANRDSCKISATSGYYNPLSNLWTGKNGKVGYERAGYALSDVFIQLSDYQINMKTSRYVADSVNFYNTIYFKEALLGKMEEKVLEIANNDLVSYPSFESYDDELVIKDVFDNTDFYGKYRQVGNRVKCGTKNNSAKLLVYQNIKQDSVPKKILRLQITAENFIFNKERFTAQNAMATFYVEDEKIIHPLCEVRFDKKNNEFSIIHPASSTWKLPIQDFYHELMIDAEAIYFNPRNDFLDFRMLKIPQRHYLAIFESSSLYSPSVMEELMKGVDYNPIYKLQQATLYYGSNTLEIHSVAEFFNISEGQAKLLMLKMSSYGFLLYNTDTKAVTVNEKLFNYMKASANNQDYDVIRIFSDKTDAPNARLNLKTGKMRIFGVDKVLLSAAKNVYIQPDSNFLDIGKNRQITFSGLVHCGKFDFETQNSIFDYEKFIVDVGAVADLSFYVKDGEANMKGEYNYKKIENKIRDLSGYIIIDSADNKSGKVNYPEFPTFVSTKEAYVYFDDPKIQKGAYEKDKFRYVVNTFTLKGLNNLDAHSLSYKGFLESGIFPNIEQDLKVMPDKSFGFVYIADNLSTYGKAFFSDSIFLSNRGLAGSGRFDYNYSSVWSDKFLFLPDAMSATSKKFVINDEKNIANYPKTDAAKLSVTYQSEKDELNISATSSEPALVYDSVKIIGNILLATNQNLILNGKMLFPDKSEIASNHLILQHSTAFGDDVNVNIFSKKSSKNAVSANNVEMNADFATNVLQFKQKNPYLYNKLIINKFIHNLESIDWNRNSDKVDFYTSKENADFISIDPKQDSLHLLASKAVFDVLTDELSINNLSAIFVADIAITPNNGELLITDNAKVKDFDNAVLQFNVQSKLHTIYNAYISIQGRKKYTAKGYYNYLDKDKSVQPIYFTDIAPNSSGMSIAKTKISDSNLLHLSPAFDYKGEITLNANEQKLQLNGNVKVVSNCSNYSEPQYFAFNAKLDPQNIEIPIVKPLGTKSISNGLGFYANSQGLPFVSIFGKLKSTDQEMTDIAGKITYDYSKSTYLISDTTQNPPSSLQIQSASCGVISYGKIDLQLNTGKFKTDVLGKMSNISDSIFTIDAAMSLDFFFHIDALKILEESIKKVKDGVSNHQKYNDFILSKTDKSISEKMQREMSLYGSFRTLPANLTSTILFSDVYFKWNAETRSWISYGDLGIAMVGKENLNRKVKGHIQIQRVRRGDIVNFYFEIAEREWYFFSYSDGFLQAYSSNRDFNDIIGSTKEALRTDKTGDKNEKYQYTISSPKRRNDFVRLMENIKNSSEIDED
ncbi:MAG: hypothetical protein LBC89_00425, partial [Bacteroidales bacterium]|nr:hypothetical protein [Bacteroidales bacterium]